MPHRRRPPTALPCAPRRPRPARPRPVLAALSLGALLGATPAAADLPPEDRALAGAQLAAGLASDGSLCNGDLDLGLIFDPDGPSGPAPIGGDALTPGWCFELWAVRASDGRGWVQGEAHAGTTVAMESAALAAGPGIQALRVTGADDDLVAQWDVVLREDEGLLLFVVELEALNPLPGVVISRIFDADLDAWVSGTYATLNRVDDAVVTAASAFDGRAVALSAGDGLGGRCAWCESDALLDTAPGESEGDDQLGVFVELGDLAAGERRRVTFAYAVGDSADRAAEDARSAAEAGDLDADGAADGDDCAPLDARQGPGLAEVADGLDNDCDGATDEGDGATPSTPRDDWDQAGAGGGAGDGADDGGGVSTADGADDPGKASAGCGAAPARGRSSALLAALAAALGLTAARARRRSLA
jgi:hypothetical protein